MIENLQELKLQLAQAIQVEDFEKGCKNCGIKFEEPFENKGYK